MNYKSVSRLSLAYGIFLIVITSLDLIFGFFKSNQRLLFLYSITSTLIYCKIMLAFINLVNKKYKNKSLDNFIITFIIISILDVFLDLFLLLLDINIEDINFLENLEILLLFLSLVFFLGIVTIIYSFKLRKVSKELSFKIYANMELCAGISLLTIIGAGILGIFSGISFIYLYSIFNNYKKEEKINVLNNKEKVYSSDYSNTKYDDKNIVIDSNKSKEENIEDYFNSLSLSEYENIKLKALAYLPKNLSYEEVKLIIKQYIEREIIK